MQVVSNVLVIAMVLQSLWAMVLEMFLWTKPTGMRVFGTTPETAEIMAVMAKNQGLYNGFLAAGLLWALSLGATPSAWQIKVFFAVCLVVAGVYGAATTGKRALLFFQGGPAILALVALFLSRPTT